MKIVQRKDTVGEWEQVVFAEVLVPGIINPYGDVWTEQGVKDAAYLFMQQGFKMDVNHDNVDISDKVYVVESFIAREGDPDFIPGSWVVATKVEDPDIWERILSNEITGYSYEAVVGLMGGVAEVDASLTRIGTTQEADGHRHTYTVFLDEEGRVSFGGTDTVNGHSHSIVSATVTTEAQEHSHRYTIVGA